MSKQSVSLVEFSKLYNIIYEIKDLFAFNIYNYTNVNDFINEIKNNNIKCLNSVIIIEKKNELLLSETKLNKNNIIIFNQLPIKIDLFIDQVNTKIIKQKYNFQSKLNIKNYILNLNSRIISNKNKELKLTEREIDIVLFLNKNSEPQSVSRLQDKVWQYSFNLETHTVETHIYRLRKKIKDLFNDESFIISDEKGYKI